MPTEQDLIGALRQADAAGDTDGAKRIAGMISAARAQAPAAGTPPVQAGPPPTTGQQIGSTMQAGASSLLGAVPIIGEPIANAAGAVGKMFSENLQGRTINPVDAYQQAAASNQAAQAAHPAVSILGTVAGIGVGGVGMGAAAKAAEAAPGIIGAGAKAVNSALELRKGQLARNALRLAVPGAAVAGVQSQVEGEGLTPQAAMETGLGAAGGVVGGAVAAKVGQFAQKAEIRLLAKHLNETPDTIAQAMLNFRAQTNRAPSIGEVLDMQSRGELRQFGSRNPAYTQQVAETLQARETMPPKVTTGNVSQPDDPSSIMTRLQQRMDTAMGDKADPAALRNQPVTSGIGAPSFLEDPRVARALRGDPELTELVNDAVANPTHAPLTVDDFDNLRQSLRAAQKSSYATNSIRASKIGDVADAVERYAYQKQPAYRAALLNNKADLDYHDAFVHGLSGGSRTNPPNDLIKASLATPTGDLGYRRGVAEAQAAQNLSELAPGTIRPQEDITSGQIAHGVVGAAKMASSPWWAGYHITKAIPGLHASPDVASAIAQSLLDPNQAQHTINLLRANGVTEEDISRTVSAVSALAGQKAASLPLRGRQQ